MFQPPRDSSRFTGTGMQIAADHKPCLGSAVHLTKEIHMTGSKLSRLLTIMAAALALSACAGDHTPRDTAQYTDDASINTNVQAAVVGVPGVHANDVQVSTYEGVVKLRGTVENQLAAQNAIQAARQVAGVKKVEYDIKVDQPY